jgi:hypothetical protein
MKSNYNEVINDIFPEYLARGRFDIDVGKMTTGRE